MSKKNKDVLQCIKANLEMTGTKFGEYYCGIIIHQSGPRPDEFFEAVNEGTYTIHVLKVPSKFVKETVDMKELTLHLTNRTKK